MIKTTNWAITFKDFIQMIIVMDICLYNVSVAQFIRNQFYNFECTQIVVCSE